MIKKVIIKCGVGIDLKLKKKTFILKAFEFPQIHRKK